MNITIKSIFEPVNPVSISKFESVMELKLPDEYKLFLIRTNGGFPKPDVFHISDFQGNSIVDIFYGIPDGIEYSHLDLVRNYKDTRLDLPKKVIPIGHDPGGNYICICLAKENYGKIYFWDHEEPNEDAEGKPNFDNMHLIANSFTEFIEKLR